MLNDSSGNYVGKLLFSLGKIRSKINFSVNEKENFMYAKSGPKISEGIT